MGKLILCRGRIAAMPYYIEQASLNIYSLEELCYYLEQYTDRLDETFFQAELEHWIEMELELKELSASLRECREQELGMVEAVGRIFHACGYLSQKEIASVTEQLKEFADKDIFTRGRMRADRYVKNHRYAAGIMEYRALLRMAEEEGRGAVETGDIWHNMGVACANMFLYEQAAECMEKAYRYNNQPESLIEMYFARQCMAMQRGESEEIPEEWHEQVLERLQQACDMAEAECKADSENVTIEQWKKKYRMYGRMS